jgi:hypothetical protein
MTGVDNSDYEDGRWRGANGTTIPVPDVANSTAFDVICRGKGFTINPAGADDLVSHLSRIGH